MRGQAGSAHGSVCHSGEPVKWSMMSRISATAARAGCSGLGKGAPPRVAL